jgi:hypothetical protein
MKLRSFLCAATLAAVGAFSGMAWAQDTGSGQGTGTGMRGRLDFLTADEKAHLLRVREQVMTQDPSLKTEGENLRKEWQDVHGQGADASAQDKETLRQNFKEHRDKVDADMIKSDPSVAPILEKVKDHMQERAQSGGAGGSSNP